MAQEQVVPVERTGSDMWVAVGVVVCLALGAGVTYWLTSEAPSAEPVATVQRKGAVMGAAKPKDPAVETKTATPVEPTTVTTDDGDYLSVSFETLSSYLYLIPDLDDPVLKTEGARPKDQIPQPIKELNGKRVAIRGFMVPNGQESGGVKSFMLVRDQSVCCYGRIPRMNEWISVAMEGKKTTRLIKDQPVTVYGVLHVGELIEKGVVLSVYRFDAHDVAGPLDF